MQRTLLALAATLATTVVPATALAAPAALPPVKKTLNTSGSSAAVCHDGLRSGPGTARATYRAPMSGFVTVRGTASRGNWDLAVFDKDTRRAMASSESFGSSEVAQSWVGAGQRLVIQGCFKGGKRSAFRIATAFVDAKPPEPSVPSLVRVKNVDDGILQRLESLGFDVTHHQHAGEADVVAPASAKLDLLEKSGLTFDVLSSDLRRDYLKARAADARAVKRAGGSPLPSGRESYRTYADYQTELAQIVKDFPGLVRPIDFGTSYQGRAVQGIEVAENVNRADDGRPTYLLVALHHAREWPSAEVAMEFAHLITKGYGSDPQITSLLRKERIVIVPIINPDGFIASRGTEPDPADTLLANGLSTEENYDALLEAMGQEERPLGVAPYDWDTVEGVFLPFGGNLAYRRKNCNGAVPNGPGHKEQNLPCYYQYGVDPNRNYGYGWGGTGASTDPNSQSYRGDGQWSEPETQNVWKFSQTRNISMLITLHNVAALVLRPPGAHNEGLAPDEPRMKELGDAMADAAGYTSQYSFQLYDTTGNTEDWTYGGQGSFGFTIEIGPVDGRFHMPYETGVVKEWTGHSGREGRGMREALLIAAEAAANPGDHAVVAGTARPGSLLRLRKTFETESSPVCTFAQGTLRPGSPLSPLDCVAPGEIRKMPDKVEYTTVVPSSGQFEWHVPPSTRPFVRRKVIPGELERDPYATEEWNAEASDIRPDGEATERRFTVTEETTNLEIDLSWLGPQDFDLELYRVAGDGSLEPVDTSGSPPALPEHISVENAKTGEYVARIVYFLTGAQDVNQANNWTLTLQRFRKSPDTVEIGREEYTLTCETPAGQVLESQQLYVDRGETKRVDLACGAGAQAVLGAKSRSARDVIISRRKVRLTRTGYARVRVACRKGAKAPCSGVLKLRTVKKFRTRGRKKMQYAKLGETAFAIRAGRTAVVKVLVTPAARGLVRRHRRGLRVYAFAVARDSAGNALARNATLRVLPPKKR